MKNFLLFLSETHRVVGGRLPAGHVDSFGEPTHLGELCVVEAAKSGGAASLLAEVAHQFVQLRCRQGLRVRVRAFPVKSFVFSHCFVKR